MYYDEVAVDEGSLPGVLGAELETAFVIFRDSITVAASSKNVESGGGLLGWDKGEGLGRPRQPVPRAGHEGGQCMWGKEDIRLKGGWLVRPCQK